LVARTEYPDRGHVVQFYGHEEELADRVAGYLLGALQHDGVAVVIATAAHRRAFERRLTQAGVDLAAAARAGTYRTLDAGDAVRALTTGGQLDRGAFDRVIGSLIADAGQGERPVRAYGEMVALLWDDGLVYEALQLEALWEELGGRHPFSLLCGYRADSMARDIDAYAEVCRLHGEIAGSRSGTIRTFAFSREAPAAARHFTVATLAAWGAADFAEDAALVVTELAANAIVHAHSAFTVILSALDDLLRISVRDATPLRGNTLRAVPLHGLGAVDAMASQWGVEPLGAAGKTVWVDLHR
jgi:hypothetical protein